MTTSFLRRLSLLARRIAGESMAARLLLATRLVPVRLFVQNDESAVRLDQSFCPDWYILRYPEVRAGGLDPQGPDPPGRLPPDEKEAILAQLYSPRFRDWSPAHVCATLIDEGLYMCSPCSMYRGEPEALDDSPSGTARPRGKLKKLTVALRCIKTAKRQRDHRSTVVPV